MGVHEQIEATIHPSFSGCIYDFIPKYLYATCNKSLRLLISHTKTDMVQFACEAMKY